MKPPRWADKFLEWYCNTDLLEDLQGDLHERFNDRVKRRGKFWARILFVIDVISFFRPYTMRRPKRNRNNMILPNLRFSLRYLTKQKFFTALHITGLTLGISVSIVIFMFIQYEMSFDSQTSRADRTYRVNSIFNLQGRRFELHATPVPLSEAIRNEFPGIESVTLVMPQYKSTVAITPDQVFNQDYIAIVEPSFLDIFDINIIKGDRKALRNPYEALISQSTTQKFFGDEDPVGKSFRYRSKYDIKVTGVFSDMPGNSSFPVSVLISYIDDRDFTHNGGTWYFGGALWTTLPATTFVVLEDNADPSAIQAKLDFVAEERINKDKSAQGEHVTATLSLQPLREIHTDAKHFGGGPWVAAIDPKWLLIFGGIGFAVLLLACVNFVNLSTAQAIVRSKEAGIRKTIGAGRRELIVQFLTESLILVFVSGALAILATILITDSVNLIVNKHIDVLTLASPSTFAVVFGGLLVTGLAAGLYPAWLISRTNTVTSLKPGGQSKGIVNISWLRQTLVVFQFAISAVLMIIVFTIARQAEFIHSRDLGFRKDDIITVTLPDSSRAQSFINKVKMIPDVVGTSLSRSTPLSDDHWWNTMGRTANEEIKTVCVLNGDEDFCKLYDLKLLAGRIPTPTIPESEIHQVIVNEELLRILELGSPSEAVGKRFSWSGTAEITGVIADFNSEPLFYGIMPVLIYQNPEVYTHANIRIGNGLSEATLNSIESLWRKEFPSEPYDLRILTDEINSYYKNESTTYKMFIVFAGVAVLISCLGLLGLCVFATVRRVREISIRKVLGASVNSLLLLLSGQFMKIVTIACIVALPVAWWSINFVLGFYAFRIDLTWELLLLPMIVLMIIAFVTMLTQTIQASMASPVKNLKSE